MTRSATQKETRASDVIHVLCHRVSRRSFHNTASTRTRLSCGVERPKASGDRTDPEAGMAQVDETTTTTTKEPRREPKPVGGSGGGALGEARHVLTELECTVCTELLLEPVTTPCGHTFCRACLRRSMDHSTNCPTCRTVLLLSHAAPLPVNVTLAGVIAKLFPEALSARREMEEETARAAGTAGGDDAGDEGNLPFFVMDVMLPGQTMQLNIFEPRYRLLIRRCMEGTRRFGMIGYDQSRGCICEWGTECEIVECVPVPDGRFYITIVGRRRLRVLSERDQDGYVLARVKYVADVEEGAGGEGGGGDVDEEAVEQEGLNNLVARWLEIERQHFPQSSGGQMRARWESKPTMEDLESFSWWFADFFPLSPSHRLTLLATTSAKERLLQVLRFAEAQLTKVTSRLGVGDGNSAHTTEFEDDVDTVDTDPEDEVEVYEAHEVLDIWDS